MPAPPQTMGDSRFRGNGECFNFASSLYFHFCPAPFLISHSRSLLPFPPLFPFRPLLPFPPFSHSHPPFPFPRKRESPDSCANGANYNKEVQSGRCPPRPRQWEIPAFAGMGVVFFVIFLFPSLLPHFPPPSIPAKAGISLFWCGQRPHCIIGREWKYFYLMFNARGEFPSRPRPNVV